MKSFFTVVFISIVTLSSVSANWKQGSIGQVRKDGVIDYSKHPDYEGFPVFKEWSLTDAQFKSKLHLKGKIVSSNTRMAMPGGSKVFVQYENLKPEYLTISGEDGSVDKLLSKIRTIKGVAHPLSKIYLGRAYSSSPFKLGTFVRTYRLSKAIPKSK